MPRPKKWRKVCCLPKSSEFHPINCRLDWSEFVILSVDEYETIRLIDYENLTQAECAKYMNVARTTVQEIYSNARKKISIALVEAMPLRIEGGEYKLCDGEEVLCHYGRCKNQKRIQENRK
ncbi:DUF134 domain-containing protein [Velocimicrobium porci]|mgnify:CR=1 FL=1|uniref:DUF134 domain-containing protein n=1 Tax=Velocimicrobium porci TaxID=2606634 RepID=UPI001F174E1E|nr:DUF134 domain-containing protein [Velocimicrobium porci]